MALPAEGTITMDNMNTDRSIASGTQINLAAAGTAYSVSYTTTGTDPLGMNEFYGKSIVPSQTPSNTPSNTPSKTPSPSPSKPAKQLSWQYTKSSPNGSMTIYKNGSPQVTATTSTSGTITVATNDVITADINAASCVSPNLVANAYFSGIIMDSACTDGSTSIIGSTSYTVLSTDTTLSLAGFSICSSGCI